MVLHIAIARDSRVNGYGIMRRITLALHDLDQILDCRDIRNIDPSCR